ncbi:MAG: hypothetical protein V1676_01155 [Candidatus Diapherotrites archaeon]
MSGIKLFRKPRGVVIVAPATAYMVISICVVILALIILTTGLIFKSDIKEFIYSITVTPAKWLMGENDKPATGGLANITGTCKGFDLKKYCDSIDELTQRGESIYTESTDPQKFLLKTQVYDPLAAIGKGNANGVAELCTNIAKTHSAPFIWYVPSWNGPGDEVQPNANETVDKAWDEFFEKLMNTKLKGDFEGASFEYLYDWVKIVCANKDKASAKDYYSIMAGEKVITSIAVAPEVQGVINALDKAGYFEKAKEYCKDPDFPSAYYACPIIANTGTKYQSDFIFSSRPDSDNPLEVALNKNKYLTLVADLKKAGGWVNWASFGWFSPSVFTITVSPEPGIFENTVASTSVDVTEGSFANMPTDDLKMRAFFKDVFLDNKANIVPVAYEDAKQKYPSVFVFLPPPTSIGAYKGVDFYAMKPYLILSENAHRKYLALGRGGFTGTVGRIWDYALVQGTNAKDYLSSQVSNLTNSTFDFTLSLDPPAGLNSTVDVEQGNEPWGKIPASACKFEDGGKTCKLTLPIGSANMALYKITYDADGGGGEYLPGVTSILADGSFTKDSVTSPKSGSATTPRQEGANPAAPAATDEDLQLEITVAGKGIENLLPTLKAKESDTSLMQEIFSLKDSKGTDIDFDMEITPPNIILLTIRKDELAKKSLHTGDKLMLEMKFSNEKLDKDNYKKYKNFSISDNSALEVQVN